MNNTSTMTLPRPEDRRRGDLERWVGCQGAGPNWRSEGFAEDVPPSAAACSTQPPPEPSIRRSVRPLLWSCSLGLVRG